jgi:hypothetical protein
LLHFLDASSDNRNRRKTIGYGYRVTPVGEIAMTNMNSNPLDVQEILIYISNNLKGKTGNITYKRCLGTVLDAQRFPYILVGQILQPRGPVHVLSDM